MTAQYTVADDTDNNSQRTFRGKGIVEDASIDDGILTKYNSRPSRVSIDGLNCLKLDRRLCKF